MRLITLTVLLPLVSFADPPLPPGWFLADPKSEYLAGTVDGGCGNPRSVYLESRARPSTHATVMQLFKAEPFSGQRLRFTAHLSTALQEGWAGLWMRVDGEKPLHAVAFDNMQDRPLHGTVECARPEVVLDVPASATTVAAGVVLEGAGRVELSGVRFEPVPKEVPVTDRLARGDTVGAPGQRAELLPDEMRRATGRVGAVWFSDHTLGQNRGAIPSQPAVVLHERNPSRWSDATEDDLVTVEGDVLRVKLGALSGEFQLHREHEALVITGQWGATPKFPVKIRLDHDTLEMTWGSFGSDRYFVRRLRREDTPQVDERCGRFVEYGSLFERIDTLYLCGAVLGPRPPPVQTTVALLLAGFRRQN